MENNNEKTGINTLPNDVVEFLKNHPAVERYEEVPEKVKWIRVYVKSNRDLIKFPTEYNEYKLEAVLPEIVEVERPAENPVIIPEVIEPDGDEIDMSNDHADISASKHVPKTDQELRQLALDIADDKIFTDRHIKQSEAQGILGMIFVPLAFLEPAQAKAVFEDCGMLYEYYAKAQERAVNGYPMFMTVQMLSNEECVRLSPLLKECVEWKRQFLGRTEQPVEQIAA